MTESHSIRGGRRWLRLLVLLPLAAVIVLGACVWVAAIRPGGEAKASLAAPSRLPLAVRHYDGIAVLGDGVIVVAETTRGEGIGNSLSSINPGSDQASVVNIPQQAQCQRIYARSPEALPDGRLGFLLVCQHDVTSDPPDTSSLVAFDQDRKTISTLAPLDPYLVPNGQFAWDPGMEKAVIGIGGETCRGLILATKAGPGVLPQVVEGDGHSFRLSDTADWTDGCKGTGRADWPTWSTDGRQIAFLASPASVGLEGTARVESSWAIYVIDSLSGTPRRLIGGLRDPRSLHWSPDARHLAFSGEVAGRGRGTWLFDPADGKLRKIAEQRLDWLVWSPDGGSLVGQSVADIDADPLGSELLSIPITANVESPPQAISTVSEADR